MIYAFEEYKRKPTSYPNSVPFTDFDGDEEYEIDTGERARLEAEEAERQRRIKEGMQLFVDYFQNLWW